jgi:HK97 family phage major capsid protein
MEVYQRQRSMNLQKWTPFFNGETKRYDSQTKGKNMTNSLEQSINRLEQTVQNLGTKNMNKNLERPMLEGNDQKMATKANNFIKHGEKSLSSHDGTGSLVLRKPEVSEIIERPSAPTLFRQIAGQTTINSDHMEIVKQTGNADSGWANETSLEAETKTAELVKISITAHEMYARTQISQRLIDDTGVNLENWLMTTIKQRFEALEEEAFINGTGEEMPKGFLAYEKVLEADWRWGKLAEIRTGKNGEGITADILFDTVASLKTPYLAGAVWLMSRAAFAEIRRLREPSTGRYLWQPNLREDGGSTLLGYPIMISDAMPGLKTDKTTTPITFGNFCQGYHIVDRGEFTILRDPYSAKPLVEFYVTQRLGGDVIDFEAIKLITAGE